MEFQGIDHVELYVADLEQACEHYCGRLGFAAEARLEDVDRRSLLLTQGRARLVLTADSGAGSEVADFVAEHGEGVRTVALRVADAGAAYERALRGGAAALRSPRSRDGVTSATVGGLETIVHTFVEYGDSSGRWLPGFVPVAATAGWGRGVAGPAAILDIDHLAICLPRGTLAEAEQFCVRTLGLERVLTDYLELGEQAMDSVAMQDASGTVTFTLVAPDCEEGQLVNFLAAFRGGGVQHLAFRTDDIAGAMREFTARGVEFLATPSQYYEALPARLGCSPGTAREFGRLGVLADRDAWGELLQAFTRSAVERRTVFFELIERRAARTFGTSNIRALYEAAEREQSVLAGAGAAGAAVR